MDAGSQHAETLVAALGREHVLKGWIVIVSFATGLLCIYALAAGVLFRHHAFWSSRFETVAHYYLITLFIVGFALSGITRPLFYTPFILVAVTAIGVRIAAAVLREKNTSSARAQDSPVLSLFVMIASRSPDAEDFRDG